MAVLCESSGVSSMASCVYLCILGLFVFTLEWCPCVNLMPNSRGQDSEDMWIPCAFSSQTQVEDYHL